MIQLQCRECGYLNRNLRLSDTGGAFECVCCGAVNRIIGWKENCYPVIRTDMKTAYVARNKKTDLTDLFLERRRCVPRGYYTY